MTTSHSPEHRSRYWPWVVALSLTAVALGGIVVTARDPAPGGPHPASTVVSVLLVVTFLGTGAVMLSRRPDHAVSWLLPLPGVYVALDAGLDVLELFVGPSTELWLDWVTQASWAWTFPTLAIFLPLLFPTGAPPTPRWRWVLWTGAAAVLLLTTGNALNPDLLKPAANPAAIGEGAAEALTATGGGLLLLSFVAAAVSAVVRYRRSRGVERQQLRWFVRGAAIVPFAWINAIVLEHGPYQQFGGLVLAGSLAVLPVAVTVAVLRYRLYDIDRLVSRTLSYALLSGVLVGVYALGVLGVGALLPGESSDLLVAGSTLAVAALFRPLRSRIQSVVDRRFNRSRYDAARTIEAFGARLRDEVDLGSLSQELRAAVDVTLQPRVTSLWLREGGA
ncbi:MAG: hypothetical protein KY469_15395 [Actinobacteria bacterium]|nr:hypothetical protein [Actinomycetota bacterium]